MKSKTAKLTYKNSWESDQYYFNGILLQTLKEYEIEGKRYKVKVNTVSVPYSDMGREYSGISDHYFITEKVFGKNFEFDLNELVNKHKIIPIKFTYQK